MERAPFFILFALFAAKSLFEIFLYWINLRHMRAKGTVVPDAVKDMIDGESLAKSVAYIGANAKYTIASKSFSFVLISVFYFGGILKWYIDLVHSWGMGFVWEGIVFVLILETALGLLHIPFDLYRQFVIEKKFGFNKMTAATWIGDSVKSLVVEWIMTFLLIGGSLLIVRASPNWWWLLLWGFYFAWGILMTLVYPNVIEPLFNKFTPLPDGELSRSIMEMVAKSGIKVKAVLTMDASKRSTHTNAYFSGLGATKRIVLFDTLMEKMKPDEILAVLGHEAGHSKLRHIVKTLVISQVVSLAAFYLFYRLTQTGALAQAFGFDNPSFIAQVALWGLAFVAAGYALTPLTNWLSRKHEYEADRFAAKLMGGPDAMIRALKFIAKDNLSNLYPHPLTAAFYYTHPPFLKRFEALKKLEK